VHLLGRAVRRRNHVDPVQHSGEAVVVATTFDGYPMAQQGKAAEALTAAFTSSFIGSLVAVLLITFLAPASRASHAVRSPGILCRLPIDLLLVRRLGREEKQKDHHLA